MKSFTSLEQSKKLAEILPLESADTLYCVDFDGDVLFIVPKQYSGSFRHQPELIIPCWSLAALLNVINKTYYVTLLHDGVMWNILVIHHDIDKCNHTIHTDSPVDACYEMILLLHTKHLL